MLKVINKNDNVRDYIDMAINSLFNEDPDLKSEYDYRTYEALEKALTYRTTKDINKK